MTLSALLDRLVDCPPERAGAIAVRSAGGASLSFGELAHQIRSVERGLREAGFRPGDRALYAIRPSAEAIALQLAVLRAGGVLAATDLGLGETVFESRVRMLAPRWVLTEPMLLALSRSRLALAMLRWRGIALPRLASIADATFVCVGRWVPGAPRALRFTTLAARGEATTGDAAIGNTADGPEVGSEADAFIVFTSGTTDVPKGVTHSRASVAASLELVAAQLDAPPGSVVLASGLHLVVPALLQGATVLLPSNRRFDPARLLRTLERDGVTHVIGVPEEWQRVIDHCLRARRTLPASLRLLMLGSAPVRRPFLARLRQVLSPATVVRCVYGMTEAAPVASVTLEEKLDYTGDGDLLGTCFPGVHARVADDGELFVSGPHVFRRYLGGAPVAEHATGDLARLDERGRLVLLGRRKDMIIRGHFNIYPELYESRIEAIPGVRRCALVGVYDEAVADERVVLAVEPELGHDPDALAHRVRDALGHGAGRVDAAAQPDEIMVVELPVSGRSSKVDRQALRAIVEGRLCASR